MVVVHCTHGFNRTGYLIVCYLVDEEGLSIKEALKLFSEARPHGMYKQEYLDELTMFYESEERFMVRAFVYCLMPRILRTILH